MAYIGNPPAPQNITSSEITDGTIVNVDIASDAAIAATKIAGLATVATTGAYSDVTGTPTLATVATTGAYSDLSGTPSLVASLADLGVTASAADLNTTDVTTLGTVEASKVVTADANGDVKFPDGDKATFGTGSDLQIYHNGTHSYIDEAGTGALVVRANYGLFFKKYDDDEQLLNLRTDGAVELFYNGSQKLATTSTGIDVTGNTVTDKVQTENLYRTGTNGSGIHFSTNATLPTNETSAVSNGTEDLGSNAYRWKDLYLSDAIRNGSGDLTLDASGNIILDADGGNVRFKDGGFEYGTINKNGNNLSIYSSVSNADMQFHGNDNGTIITALTLDMSASGDAIFNSDVVLGSTGKLRSNGDNDSYLQFNQANVLRAVIGDSTRMIISTGETVFNEDSGDFDFRVESDGNASMLFVDGGNNRVGIGTSSPSAGLELNLASGDGLLINSADIGTIKMKATGNGVKNWGFATTNLVASDFGIYQSNSNGGDPITAGAAKLYFNGSGNATFSGTVAATSYTGDGSSLTGVGSTTFAAVGTYAFASIIDQGATTAGTTRSGTNGDPSNAYGTEAGTYGMAGTWRCMGYSGSTSGASGSTLWCRIS